MQVSAAGAAERLRLRGEINHRPSGVREDAQSLLLGRDPRLRATRLHRSRQRDYSRQPALQAMPSEPDRVFKRS